MAASGWAHVARKDIREEARGRETLVPTLLVALLVAAVSLVAFHDVHDREAVAAGTLWVALAFASAVGMARALGAEKDRGTLETLLVLPIERGSVYAGKALALLATLLVVALVVAPSYLVASGDAWPAQWPMLVVLVALGAVGLAAVGTVLSALVANTRTRDVLLPVLLLPVLVPLLLSGIHGTLDVLAGEPFAEWRPELLVLAGYDIIALAGGWLLFDAAVGP